MIQIGIGIWSGVGGLLNAVEHIITANTPPSLGVLTADDPPQDNLSAASTDPASYDSTAGEVVSAEVISWNGVDETVAQPAGTLVTVTILVTDDQGNTRTFNASRTVQAVTITASSAPVLTAVDDTQTPADALAAVFTTIGHYTADLGATVNSATAAYTLDGSNIAAGGTLVAEQDLDATITVNYTTALGYSSSVAFEMASVVVDGIAPTISGVPTIAGIETVGETLTATEASATARPVPARTWQWKRSGVDIDGAEDTTYILDPEDEGETITVVQTETNFMGSDSAESTATGAINVVSEISGLVASDQSPSGEVVLAFTIDQDSIVSYVITTSLTTPAAGQIGEQKDHTGAAASDSGSDTWTTAGADSLENIVSGLALGTYYLHVLPAGGDDVDVVTSNGFTLDTAPPEFISATTTGPNTVVITMDETVNGTGSVGDWTLDADGLPLTVTGVSISDSEITLTVNENIVGGQVLDSLSYVPGDITDSVSNPLAGFSGETVTNAEPGGFSENSVVVDGSSYLTGSTSYASDIRSALFFASYETTHSAARQTLSGWGTGSSANVLHADFNANDGAVAVRLDMEDSLGNSILCNIAKATNTGRFHVIASVYNDGTGLYASLAVWDETSGTWDTDTDSNTGTTGVGYLSVDSAPAPRLLQDASSIASPFVGSVVRNAAWMNTAAAPIADPTSGVVQAYFQDSGTTIEDPATSQSQYGTPVYDFNGPAADYNSTTHDGDGGSTSITFTKTGTFT